MLELQSITKTWQPTTGAKRILLHDLKLRVEAGQTIAILGASGSGKSTLLKIIAGLEPVDTGRILLDGRDITHLAPHQRRFAMMFQDFALFPHLNVQDNVAFGLVEQGQRKAPARENARTMLARFGLADFAKERVTQLSGGEQQRIALARALITQPKLLLLDEPFSALDAEMRLRLRDEFKHHLTTHHTTTLFVTHDQSEAQALGTRSYRLVNGALEEIDWANGL